MVHCTVFIYIGITSNPIPSLYYICYKKIKDSLCHVNYYENRGPAPFSLLLDATVGG